MGHTDEEQAVKANFKRLQEVELHSIKGTLLSLRKCQATESPLKIMENAFHLKHSSRSHDIQFYPNFSVMSKKWLDQKDIVSFKIYDATTWLTNNCNTQIDQYLKKGRQSGNDIWQLIKPVPFYMTKKSAQKFKYLENKENF